MDHTTLNDVHQTDNTESVTMDIEDKSDNSSLVDYDYQTETTLDENNSMLNVENNLNVESWVDKDSYTQLAMFRCAFVDQS